MDQNKPKLHKRIVIVSPTTAEIEPFLESGGKDRYPAVHSVEICGAGMAEMAACTARLIAKRQPSVIILAGVAGCYPGSGLGVGDVALVESESVADMGAFRGKSFQSLFAKDYGCPFADKFPEFRKVKSNTVSAAAAPFIKTGGRDIENMEGAAFFAACFEAGVPFLELRSVSNPVAQDRQKWDVPLAARNLSVGLNELISIISERGI